MTVKAPTGVPEVPTCCKDKVPQVMLRAFPAGELVIVPSDMAPLTELSVTLVAASCMLPEIVKAPVV